MRFKNIRDIKNIRGKRILVRVDFNCSVKKGKVIENERIKAHSETLNFLKRRGARVIVIAHQGSKGESDFVCLEQHSKILNKYVKNRFVKEVIGEKVWEGVNSIKDGEILLLDNVRFVDDEFKPSKDNSLIQFFKEVGVDYFVQDAFSVCHREQTSIVSLPLAFPSFIGLVMERELENLEKLNTRLNKALFVLGGVKVKDITSLLNHRKIISTGRLALYGLTSKGIDLGVESKEVKKDKESYDKIKKNSNNLILPEYLGVYYNGKRKDMSLGEMPVNRKIYDIGKESADYFSRIILSLGKNEAVFYKGAPGNFEVKGFDYGSKKILDALSKTKAFVIISGGSGSDALKKFGLKKDDFDYISLSGGALVKYISGEKLVGLDALEKSRSIFC